MKKILFAVLTAMALVMAVGCKSTENNANALAGSKQAVEAGRPKWATAAGSTFTSKEATQFMTGDGYVAPESGYFASGNAKRGDARATQAAARMDARSRLTEYIKTESTSYAADNGHDYAGLTVETVDSLIKGSRPIDSFEADDGTIYVLMFISDSDLAKSIKASESLDSEVSKLMLEMLEAKAKELSETATVSNE